MNDKTKMALFAALAVFSAAFALVAPLEWFHFIQSDIVGMRPTGFMTPAGVFSAVGGKGYRALDWYDGYRMTGGFAMRVMAALGAMIFFAALHKTTRLPTWNFERNVRAAWWEIPLCFLAAALFIAVNVMVGDSWWDDENVLYIGKTFPIVISATLSLGIIPFIVKAVSGRKSSSLIVPGRRNLKLSTAVSVSLCTGYGMFSTLWHCCKMWVAGDYFYFFVAKIFILYPMLFFVFGYCYPLFMKKFGKAAAVVLCSVFVGALTPWHTLGFAVSFAVFGAVLWYLMKKTGTHATAFLVMYLSYITHAAFPWHGSFASWYIIVPLSALFLALVLAADFRKFAAAREDSPAES